MELGHGVYLLFCVYTLISLLWSDHLVDVLSNAVHASGLFFVCVAICDAIENSFSRFLWTVLFNVTIISALSILIVVANPDIGVMFHSSYAGLHSEFSLNGRWCGVTSHPNELGSYAAIGLLIAAYFLLNHKPLLRHSSSTLNRLLIVAFILTNIIALNGSGSKHRFPLPLSRLWVMSPSAILWDGSNPRNCGSFQIILPSFWYDSCSFSFCKDPGYR